MTEKAPPVKVPLAAIFNIFQLTNKHIYRLVPNEGTGTNVYSCMARMFQHYEAPSAAIINDDDRMTQYRTSLAQFDNDGLALTVRLEYRPEHGEKEDWIYFAIAEAIDLGEQFPDDQRYKTRPLYLLSGTLDDDNNFIAQDYICHKESKPTEDSPSKPKADDFFTTIAYADTVFLDCLLGQEIDTDKAEPYLQDSFVEIAKKYYASVKDRTAQDLSTQLTELQKPVPSKSGSIAMAPPPMPQ